MNAIKLSLHWTHVKALTGQKEQRSLIQSVCFSTTLQHESTRHLIRRKATLPINMHGLEI